MADKGFNIAHSTHPEYSTSALDWQKFRYVWEGGESFRNQYLKSYSSRENNDDFEVRKAITPIPGFATSAVTDIKNSIFQRMSGITRIGGGERYQDVMSGALGGVDLHGASMNYFVGDEILPELLFMGGVGVYTDMPEIEDVPTIDDTKHMHPYFYKYNVEDIRNWRRSTRGEFVEYDMLLLRERILTYDDVYGLPHKDSVRFRLLTREDGAVMVRFFDAGGQQIDQDGEFTSEPLELGLSRIPFTMFELKHSLLQDIADHQIALLNLESSDVAYALLANFPFYTEQQSKMHSAHLKQEESEFSAEDDREIEVGGTTGRAYAQGMNAPEFIHPSSEPLKASMEKQDRMKADIRSLVQLSLSNLQPKFASAEAKQFDEHGLESGLSFIGLILQHGEQRLASLFNEYENEKEIATIGYPERYSLKSDMERLEESEKLYDMMLKLPSKTAQKAISQLIANKVLDSKISEADMRIVISEIGDAEYITTDPDVIHADLEKGLVSTMTASGARGYDAEKEVPKAEADHAERIQRIKEAQDRKSVV